MFWTLNVTAQGRSGPRGRRRSPCERLPPSGSFGRSTAPRPTFPPFIFRGLKNYSQTRGRSPRRQLPTGPGRGLLRVGAAREEVSRCLRGRAAALPAKVPAAPRGRARRAPRSASSTALPPLRQTPAFPRSSPAWEQWGRGRRCARPAPAAAGALLPAGTSPASAAAAASGPPAPRGPRRCPRALPGPLRPVKRRYRRRPGVDPLVSSAPRGRVRRPRTGVFAGRIKSGESQVQPSRRRPRPRVRPPLRFWGDGGGRGRRKGPLAWPH